MVAERGRTGAFAADVEEMDAIKGHLMSLGESIVNIGVKAAIGERVRGDVQDTHDERS